MNLRDGLYQVTTPNICAGFVIWNGRLVYCAPILRKGISFWAEIAKRVGP